jgi:predicted  nucleic acid-binding Zn-ribbon protein
MLSKLTEQAAERFAAMGDRVEDAQRQMHGVQQRIGDVEQQMRNTNPDTQGEEFAALQRELDRQSGRLREAQHSFLELSRLHTAIRTWIAQLAPAVQLEDVEVGFADLASGELHNDAVVRVRCEIKDLANERSAIRHTLPPVEEVCAEADAQIDDALAARGRPSVPRDGKPGSDQAAALLGACPSNRIFLDEEQGS